MIKKNKRTREGKPLNDLQRLASTENWALFQLKGMLGNLIHLSACDTLPIGIVSELRVEMLCAVAYIKKAQKIRKAKRNG